MSCENVDLPVEPHLLPHLEVVEGQLCRTKTGKKLLNLQSNIESPKTPPKPYGVDRVESFHTVFKDHFESYFGKNIYKIDTIFQDEQGNNFLVNDASNFPLMPGQILYVKNQTLYVADSASALNPPKKRTVLAKKTKPKSRHIPKQRPTLMAQLDIPQKPDHWQQLNGDEFRDIRQQLIQQFKGDSKRADKAIADALQVQPGLVRMEDINLDFPNTYRREISQAARRYGVSPKWIEDVIYIESKGFPFAISLSMAMGLMQMKEGVYDKTHDRVGKYGILEFDSAASPLNPAESIDRGTDQLARLKSYLSPLIQKYNLNERTVIFQAYNAGSGAVERAILKDGIYYERNLSSEAQKYVSAADPFRSILVAQR